MSDLFTHLWYWWMDLVSRIGLPTDKHTAAVIALALVFYAIGKGFKTLTQKEK
jgi:hypothetical protein